MSYLYQIIETEEQPVLVVEKTLPVSKLPEVVGLVFQSIAEYLYRKGDEPLGPAFIAYHNMDMNNLQVEIGFPVKEKVEGEGEIKASVIPAGKKAVGYHKGPYRDISPLYDGLSSWIFRKGYEPSGIAYEYYFNSPGEIPESELLTKVEFLLK